MVETRAQKRKAATSDQAGTSQVNAEAEFSSAPPAKRQRVEVTPPTPTPRWDGPTEEPPSNWQELNARFTGVLAPFAVKHASTAPNMITVFVFGNEKLWWIDSKIMGSAWLQIFRGQAYYPKKLTDNVDYWHADPLPKEADGAQVTIRYYSSLATHADDSKYIAIPLPDVAMRGLSHACQWQTPFHAYGSTHPQFDCTCFALTLSTGTMRTFDPATPIWTHRSIGEFSSETLVGSIVGFFVPNAQWPCHYAIYLGRIYGQDLFIHKVGARIICITGRAEIDAVYQTTRAVVVSLV